MTEHHSSLLDLTSSVLNTRLHLQNVLLAAYLVEVKLVPVQVEQKVSHAEWRYWLNPCIAPDQSQRLRGQALAGSEVIKGLAALYWGNTNIPASAALSRPEVPSGHSDAALC